MARDRDAGRVDDVGLDAARPQPAGEPEPVAAGLEGDREPGDRASRPGRLVPPAPEQGGQRLPARAELLEGLAPDPGHQPGDEPARPAQLDRLSSTTATSVPS